MKVANIIGYLLFGFLCVFVYKTFTDPIIVRVAAEEPPKVKVVTSDEQCVTWLFQSNLAQAKERMCGRRVK